MTTTYPKVNYIGNKLKLSNWICDNIPLDNSHCILDLFSGGTSVSYALKKEGYTIIANDSLYASYVLAKALIENENVTLDLSHVINASNIEVPQVYIDKMDWLSYKLYYPYEVKELAQLSYYAMNLEGYEKYLFLSLLRRAMIRKLPYSRMNLDWKNIVKLRDEEYSYRKYGRRRAYHNLPFIEHIKNDIENYNNAIFSNGKNNKAVQMDAFDAIKKYGPIADIVYIDPPYPGTMNNYFQFYGIFDQIFEKNIDYTNFTQKKDFINTFENLIYQSHFHFTYAVISLNSNIKPDITEVLSLLSKYGNYEIFDTKHNYQVSGKINKHKNKEILVILKFNQKIISKN
ncbi:DNA adenine methylase [Staphylococcus argensis]|uniref:site-specific DNA-methyltransferase (adenine-specific) n=1 Tax=Staphylococcus argensis TaxID=1607738 RepID=A0A2K4FAK9_9STAP|nr:DNA adenine methylase [Staphylococcus argensis]MCY6991375.1 DNA adenine methylase [Staphylococcus argensis]POA08390.1 DNA methyltransferase [Staphylococcus argensis]